MGGIKVATFIIADTNFYNDEQRQKMNFSSFEEMNQHIVKNWNLAVAEDDNVIIMGRIGEGEKDKLKELFSQLNGNFTALSRHLNDLFTKEEWRDIGFTYFWNVPMFYDLDEEHHFLYLNRPIINIKPYEEEYCLVVVDSENPIENMTQGILFSADAIKWDYCPINTDNLYEIYQNMKEFEEMETTEHRSDIKEDGENEST